MFQKTQISNGLRLLKAPMTSVKSITALVMIEAGSRYEAENINGISHFIEHMPSKGTKKRPSSLAISSLIDSIGGISNAFTSKEYTGFFIKSASEHLDLILDIISDELLEPLFDPKEIDNERGVIVEEINMYEDQPQARVGEVFEDLLYKTSPLARRILGTKENIMKISREEMLSYQKKMYHSGSLVVCLAGDLAGAVKGKDSVDSLVNKYFSPVPVGKGNQFAPAADQQSTPASAVYFKQSDQAHLCLGVRAYPLGHPDRYALAILSSILGGTMSSRLFLEVREKRGLAYYVSTGTEEFHDAGYLVSQAGLRLSAMDEAIKVILEQYSLMATNKVTNEELKRAKDYWKGRMVLALEDSYRVASFYASQEILERTIETPEEVISLVNKVTAEDIQRVAKDIFVNRKLNLAVVGPFKEEDKFSKLLTIS